MTFINTGKTRKVFSSILISKGDISFFIFYMFYQNLFIIRTLLNKIKRKTNVNFVSSYSIQEYFPSQDSTPEIKELVNF